jgi:hypothetical protein
VADTITAWDERALTAPTLPIGRLRHANEVPVDNQLRQQISRLAGSPTGLATGQLYGIKIGEENSGPHRIARPLDSALEMLRRRTTIERTEALLQQVLEHGTPAEIIARLIDDSEASALKSRLVTLLPNLKGKYREADLIAVLGLLAVNDDSEIRYVVADALAAFPGDGSSRILRVLVNDQVSTVRSVARESLAEIE